MTSVAIVSANGDARMNTAASSAASGPPRSHVVSTIATTYSATIARAPICAPCGRPKTSVNGASATEVPNGYRGATGFETKLGLALGCCST